MKVRLMLAAAIAVTGVMLVGASTATAAPPATQAITLPTNTCTLAGGALCSVQLTGFQVVNGQLSAVINVVNSATGAIVSTVTTPVTGALPGASCQILDLTIGPIHLDLLGLVVDTNAIHLNITAVPGAGNLLGNLLCAVAGLLDNNNLPLNGIANLLNNILRQGGMVTPTAVPTA
jgi:hypothetical protein